MSHFLKHLRIDSHASQSSQSLQPKGKAETYDGGASMNFTAMSQVMASDTTEYIGPKLRPRASRLHGRCMMRTVSTLCAASCGLSLPVAGLTLAREVQTRPAADTQLDQRTADMTTAVATYSLQAFDTRSRDTHFISHRAGGTLKESGKSTPRAVVEEHDVHGQSLSEHAKRGQHRQSLVTPRPSIGMDESAQREGNDSSPAESQSSAAVRPRSFLRRWSGNIPLGSRDSSRTSVSRPSSATVSYSNGSMTLSNSDSTTPIFGRPVSGYQRNKLVKRAPSLSSSNGLHSQSSPASRLPVLRRPATSHQRTATQQHQQSRAWQRESATRDSNELELRHYFTPKIIADKGILGQRRNSTGIPNPIRRVYPDRKYTPVLVSARDVVVKPSNVEFDDGSSDEEENPPTATSLSLTVTSSPAFDAASAHAPRRSFSIGDLLSTGPQPLWRRPSSSASKSSASRRLSRKSRPRVATEPTPMGSSFDQERPAKRRDLTDPYVAYRDIYSSSDARAITGSHTADFGLDSASETPRSQDSSFRDSPLADTFPQFSKPSPNFGHDRSRFATAESSVARSTRLSAPPSANVSTTGSDSERRSAGGYSTDYQSESAYDSFQTRTTRSISGKRGPPIDTIFDESPPVFSSGRSTRLGDLLNDGHFSSSGQGTGFRHSTIEEEESVISTPVRSNRDKSVTTTPSAGYGPQHLFPSSPPVMADPDEIDWDAAVDEPMRSNGLGTQPQDNNTSHYLSTYARALCTPSALSRPANGTSAHSTPNRWSNGGTGKAKIFDWVEQQPSPSHPDRSPPRPRTVHGKKDPENRGSRMTGRRAPSGMHARSQSVPVVPVPDLDGKRTAPKSKFGTWGVGSKNVTEDWDDDFEFEDSVPPLPAPAAAVVEKRIDSGHQMFVPKAIQESHHNVVANMNLLKEWGMHIEELKDLRMRAATLDMLHGAYEKEWQEVDGMIALADQSSSEQTLQPRPTPPSSPGFDMNTFDETTIHAPVFARSRSLTAVRLADNPPFDDAEAGAVSPQQLAVCNTLTLGRPRKDSEAMARLVIEALQAQHTRSHSPAVDKTGPTKKVDFNTSTLRRLVPHVKDLTRRVKEALRETEGLYSSPRRRDSHDSNGSADEDYARGFRHASYDPSPGSPTELRRSRRDMALTDHDGVDEGAFELPRQQRGDLAQRMQNLTLSPR
ncbi:hypothetical protein EJ03DRAFT_334671 [Teratosphaeria nubilosa]|uniref:Uncharacterized protein n=1 Tax=Teratosphaeria nubilosa TaxID=161662 RepID=A0A6G1LFX5_9PEZI|nr:hypothetical protein EJ03DRAFT_334671 [Teratosphaeria nubilosa]